MCRELIASVAVVGIFGLALGPLAHAGGRLDNTSAASGPDWTAIYAGSRPYGASAVVANADGSFVIAGRAGAFDIADDAWLMKVGPGGDVVWQKSYGGGGSDGFFSLKATPDGGYVAAGDTFSFAAGIYDIWVMKFDAGGDVVWQKAFRGPRYDFAFSVDIASDGGYILAGSAGFVGTDHAFLMKLDSSGAIVWQKTYSGSGSKSFLSVRATADGGYIAAGRTDSLAAGNSDAWVVKVDALGNVVWQRAYGGSGDDEAMSVQPTPDGGYVVAGYTVSFGAAGQDGWILKLDGVGSVDWQKRYGGAGDDSFWSIRTTPDGGYVVVGQTASFPTNDADLWVVKVDAGGQIVWQNTFGSVGHDGASDVEVIANGYVVAGKLDTFRECPRWAA